MEADSLEIRTQRQVDASAKRVLGGANCRRYHAPYGSGIGRVAETDRAFEAETLDSENSEEPETEVGRCADHPTL